MEHERWKTREIVAIIDCCRLLQFLQTNKPKTLEIMKSSIQPQNRYTYNLKEETSQQVLIKNKDPKVLNCNLGCNPTWDAQKCYGFKMVHSNKGIAYAYSKKTTDLNGVTKNELHENSCFESCNKIEFILKLSNANQAHTQIEHSKRVKRRDYSSIFQYHFIHQVYFRT